jgi:ubiquitin-conjugating enzyme (huntingtin interacting protein 2)
MENRPEFDRTAKQWTDLHAKEGAMDAIVDEVCEMGFDKASARQALEANGWNKEAAINSLLG